MQICLITGLCHIVSSSFIESRSASAAAYLQNRCKFHDCRMANKPCGKIHFTCETSGTVDVRLPLYARAVLPAG
jgi:hypothetical protein